MSGATDQDVLVSLPGALEAVVVSLKVSQGDRVRKGTSLCTYYQPEEEGSMQSLKSPVMGVVSEVMVKEEERIAPGKCVVRIQKSCDHSVVAFDLCAICGINVKSIGSSNVQGTGGTAPAASVSMLHGIPQVKVSHQEAQRLGDIDKQSLLNSRKLALIVDLDQTLVHTSVDPNIHRGLPDVYGFKLAGHPFIYHCRLRPYVRDFLTSISSLYELHVCTMGTRDYAHSITKILDKKKKLFSDRIISRNEFFDPNSKALRLKSLFPCGDEMVAIIDDREDVWGGCPNLVHVKPYLFFAGTDDINAPPTSTPTAPPTSVPTAPPTYKKPFNSVEGVGGVSASNRNKNNNNGNGEGGNGNHGNSEGGNGNHGNSEGGNGNHGNSEGGNGNHGNSEGGNGSHGNEGGNGNHGNDDGNTNDEANMRTSQDNSSSTSSDSSSDSDSSSESSNDDNTESTMEVDQPTTTNKIITTNNSTGASKPITKSTTVPTIVDNDEFLVYLTDILTRLHNIFYTQYDNLTKGTEDSVTPDLKEIIPSLRKSVLKGTRLLFTGVIPTNMKIERSREWNTAKAFGAVVHTSLIVGERKIDPEKESSATTHVIVGRKDTAKYRQAKKVRGVKLVSPGWFWDCAERWKHLDESLYPVEEDAEVFQSLEEKSEKVAKKKSPSKSLLSSATVHERKFSVSTQELDIMEAEIDAELDTDDDEEEEEESFGSFIQPLNNEEERKRNSFNAYLGLEEPTTSRKRQRIEREGSSDSSSSSTSDSENDDLGELLGMT